MSYYNATVLEHAHSSRIVVYFPDKNIFFKLLIRLVDYTRILITV